MPMFELPDQSSHVGWGPALGQDIPQLDDIEYPIESINRYPPARIGKVVDFTQATQDRVKAMLAREAVLYRSKRD